MKKLIVLSLILAACSSGKDHEGSQADAIDSLKKGQTQPYQYEPAISVLTGKLETENFWGPPGYGEDTLTDMKENCAMLILDAPIDVLADTSGEFNQAADDVGTIQLASTISLTDYVGKRVTIKGKLFGAQTAHHHTPVLLDVTSVEAR
jgi:hypothetical protein